MTGLAYWTTPEMSANEEALTPWIVVKCVKFRIQSQSKVLFEGGKVLMPA
jgi:hypothetical protein